MRATPSTVAPSARPTTPDEPPTTALAETDAGQDAGDGVTPEVDVEDELADEDLDGLA